MKILITSVLFIIGILGTKISSGFQELKHPEIIVKNDSLVPVKSQNYGIISSDNIGITYNALEIPKKGTVFYKDDFSETRYGAIPRNWEDLYKRLPSRNWMVDDQNFLRPVLKNKRGLIAYHLSKNNQEQLGNFVLEAKFKKTEDDSVRFGIAGRIQDKNNFYAVLFKADDKVVIVKVKDNKILPLTEIVSLKRYNYPDQWNLTASFHGDLITGILKDGHGNTLARADARDGEFTSGTFGLYCTEFAACKEITCYGETGLSINFGDEAIEGDPLYTNYQLIRPVQKTDKLNTNFNDLDNAYDLIVAGAGTGGWAAAVQAARMGRRVLLVEETDWIGGQMAAGVTSMDESGAQARERGIYREFHESMILYYYGLDKDPFQAYYYGRSTQNQQEGGYAPCDVKAMLYGFINDAKKSAGKGCLDLVLRTKVEKVFVKKDQVTGVELVHWGDKGNDKKSINCKILIDATEYGDLIPLTGALYRVGNTISNNINYDGKVQDYTYTGIIREYPNGIPDSLRLTVQPPNYELYIKSYRNKVLYGDWGLHSGLRHFRAAIAWRGMADKESQLKGRMNGLRHTLGGLNGGNDYDVFVSTVENEKQRLEAEKEGIYRTLSIIYYLQNELGIPWSFAENQGYNTPYNRMMMKKRGIAKEMLPYAQYLPQVPYVRESRRIMGLKILVADDLKRWEKASHFTTAIAMGDYFMDLHGTYDAFERDLDNEDYEKGGGPFQVPFEAFIPLTLNGFLPAEKNFSQSRLVNGATRLQPITMLTGQAVGVIAALSVNQGIQPRELNPIMVQLQLLDEGSTLIQRWYNDIAWGTELWKASQFLSLNGLMDRYGKIELDQISDGMEYKCVNYWGVDEKLTTADQQAVLKKLEILIPQIKEYESRYKESFGSELTRGEFAVQCFRIIKSTIK